MARLDIPDRTYKAKAALIVGELMTELRIQHITKEQYDESFAILEGRKTIDVRMDNPPAYSKKALEMLCQYLCEIAPRVGEKLIRKFSEQFGAKKG